MSSKSDFLSWDDSDINLDLLLGEYTMSENDSDVENPPPKKSKKDRTCAYSCPECNASYSSVSGFRGHLRKKHSLTNIKLVTFYMGSTCSTEPLPTKHIVNEVTPPSEEVTPPAPDYCQPSENHIYEITATLVSDKSNPIQTVTKKSSMASGKPPTRTVSVLKNAKDVELLKKYPDLKGSRAKFEHAQQYVQDIVNSSEDIEEYEKIHELFEENIINPSTSVNNDEQRLMMGDQLASIGFVQTLVELYKKILEENEVEDGISPTLEREDESEEYFTVVKDIRTIMWNYSDTSKEFGLTLAEETDIFQYLVRDLQAIYKEGLEDLTAEIFVFNSAIAIITNCGRAGVAKSTFNVTQGNSQEKVHMVDIIIPFLKCNEQFVKLTTLLALSYMVNEEDNRLLTADTSLFDFLLDMIKLAMKSDDKRHQGFSVHELIDGLAGLAKDDGNKVKIMEKEYTYPMLKDSILKCDSEQQLLAAVRAIWELSFARVNKNKFSNDKDLMSKMEELQQHNNPEIANSSGRALFVIKPDNEKNLMKSVIGEKSQLDHPEQKHIMISYQWGNQKTILRIRQELAKYNYPVWIDVELMEGSMLQMMASAIENASIVLICYSEKYKDSKNCRTEAEYAFAKDKIIIPVLCQRGYRPDGWLGILVGAKKYYEFSEKYDFDKKFREMKMEIDGVFGTQNRKQSILPQPSFSQPAPLSGVEQKEVVLLQWKKQDIDNWLQQNDLQAFSDLHKLTGEKLLFLYKLFIRAPDTFYRCLENKLGLKSLEDLMKFDKALTKLSQQHPEINNAF